MVLREPVLGYVFKAQNAVLFYEKLFAVVVSKSLVAMVNGQNSTSK